MNIRSITIGLAAALGLGACTQTMDTYAISSRFTYPNSDIQPVGRVTNEVSRVTFFGAAIMDKEVFDELYTKAAQKKGGDRVIDYIVTTEVTSYPVIPIVSTKFKLEGTVCKDVAIGRQKLTN
ncbi:MAG: hypothetical protein ABT940_09255 [Alphaproteobacteria bacterium]